MFCVPCESWFVGGSLEPIQWFTGKIALSVCSQPLSPKRRKEGERMGREEKMMCVNKAILLGVFSGKCF